jgi:hypothetical protein
MRADDSGRNGSRGCRRPSRRGGLTRTAPSGGRLHGAHAGVTRKLQRRRVQSPRVSSSSSLTKFAAILRASSRVSTPHSVFESVPEVRVLPSTGVTRLRRYYGPVRLPSQPPPPKRRRACHPRRDGSPRCIGSLRRLAVPTTPGGSGGCACRLLPLLAAFPASRAGRHPHLHFRGLLRLHSRYGPSGCSTAQGGLCHEASTGRLPDRVVHRAI